MQIRFNQAGIALYTILHKEIARFMRIWIQTLLPPATTMTLYFIIFGKLIGSQIHNISGYTYMQYIVPGLVMMSIMMSSYTNTSSSFFGTKFSKSIEEMIVAPVPHCIILLGFTLGGAVRGLLTGIIILFISLLFTHLHPQHYGIILAMAVLGSMVFSLAGFINGVYAKKFDDISFIPTFILTPLTYLGGVFYSIQQLPPFWKTLSIFNPVLEIVDTFRYGMLGIADVNIYFGFSLISLVLIALLVWGLHLLHKGIGIRT